MTATDQDGRAAGSVPNAYRNALFWRWAPEMPRGLSSSFVTVLYALAAAADPAGRVRFRDGKAIRIQDIATAAKADEKDVRRYLAAAIAAGVVAVQGERKRGRAALYVLVLHPRPDWLAAARSLTGSRRKSRKSPPWLEDEENAKNGGVSPELSDSENGGHAPELSGVAGEKERGTRPRLSSGDTPPFGSGDTPPNIPGIAKELPQEMAEAGQQPQVARANDEPHPDHQRAPEPDWIRCDVCDRHLLPRHGRTRHPACEDRPATPPARAPDPPGRSASTAPASTTPQPAAQGALQ